MVKSSFKVWSSNTEERLFYPEDLNRLISSMEGTRDPNRNTLLLLCCAYLGGRVSETVNIKVSDINIEKNLIKMLCLKRKQKGVYEWVGVHPDLMFRIEAYIKKRKLDPADYLFKSVMNPDKHICRKTAWWILKRAGIRVGFDFIHPHVFRHNLAVAYREAGIPLTVTRKQLRHVSIDTTANYDLVVTTDLSKAQDRAFSSGINN